MENLYKLELILDGLGCAHCASKIEENVSKLDFVEEASLNFVSKTLIINLKNERYREEALLKSKDIIKKLEPDVRVIEKNKNYSRLTKVQAIERHNHCNDDCCSCHDYSHNKNHNNTHEYGKEGKNKFIFLIIGAIFSIVAYNMQNTFYEIVLYVVAYILIGGDVVLKAIKNIFRGEIFDENFLMVVATLGAFGIREYPEAVSVMIFYQVGELFQGYAVDRSRKSIAELMDIKPEFANIMLNGEIKKVSPEEVNIGDIIIVKPGEKVPLDGIVIEGESFLDTSALTGESVQRKVKKDSEILSGFINKTSLINIKVTKSFGESAVSKIFDLVENASNKKSNTENFITKFARYYTPAVVITAVILATIPPLVIKDALFSDWLYRALIFLVISCPCALVISIPLGFFGGIGAASKKGILVKGSNYLEALNNVDTIIFDKTGTLTKGVFTVTEVVPYNEIDKETLLEIAAMGEIYSNHPIALSIVKHYGKAVDKNYIKDYKEISGFGIEAIVKDKKIFLGNSKLMERENIDYNKEKILGTVVHVALDGYYAGYIVISDEVKDDAKKAIMGLKLLGINNISMLTGDSRYAANKVGEELGIDKVYYELLPQDKVLKFEELYSKKSKESKILFVGDGINDAPVLARADIGVAMGGLGSDAAIEASDVVIMNDEPSKIVEALNVSKNTRRIVWQNIIFALGVKLIVLILGAFGVANMWEAVFADVGVALIAVLNSMRILKK
ncbi:heavy metal translocating P-type ATPase [Clostridium rectalis]|uniref:heavy metal translocating P-type ATPase n=1 Tax=Clostridium rectalis TaxID=2040295 RepID=UPI000F62F884|nr:heavy metal translocating P-type ATPase [Clostridium rectalis]